MRGLSAALGTALVALAGPAEAYPIDAHETTQINRLLAYDRAREGLLARGTLKPGSLLPDEEVLPALADHAGFALPAPDADFTAEVVALLGDDARHYGISVLDYTDPARPVMAASRPDRVQNPGSVGKVIVALAWFQALADLHPDDVAARAALLRETFVTADGFIRTDHHVVPIWAPGDPKVLWRPIQEGDRANLYTYLDWMASASSNAAASTLMEQLILLSHFGASYPVSAEKAAAFFRDTPKTQLQKLFLDAIQQPLVRNGLDLAKLRQGSFFTREGKRRVPGTNSVATSGELLRFLVQMERGQLVDLWSSTEIKRLLYLTDTRIRYASHPALDDSAVYFKSGSLYSCKPEPGFNCGKYLGNAKNYMNSIAIVETRNPGRTLRYAVVVLSNVLKRNSSEAHQALAGRIHRLIAERHAADAAPPVEPPGPAPDPEPPMRTSRR